MTSAGLIFDSARAARLREVKAELEKAKARLLELEQERDSLAAHFDVALVAMEDFRRIPGGERLVIVDGWNVVLRNRNVARLSGADVSRMKAEFLKGRGAERPGPEAPDAGGCDGPVREWIVFDGGEESSYRAGERRVTYTGGTGPHRADRLIVDFVHAARILGLDTSRIIVVTEDRGLAKRVAALGAEVVAA